MRLSDVPKTQETSAAAPKGKQGVTRPQTKAGKPFFSLGKAPDVGEVRHSEPTPAGRRTKLDRKTRLEGGGIPATKLAAAAAKVLSGHFEEPAKAPLTTHTRGIRLDAELIGGIEGLTVKRGVPEWIRNAIEFVAENGVAPARIEAEASQVASRRRNEASRTVVVPLGSLLLEAVREIGRRARLTDKEVIEGCAGLYYKVNIEALGDQ